MIPVIAMTASRERLIVLGAKSNTTNKMATIIFKNIML